MGELEVVQKERENYEKLEQEMDINLFKNPSSLNHAVGSFNVIKINDFSPTWLPKISI